MTNVLFTQTQISRLKNTSFSIYFLLVNELECITLTEAFTLFNPLFAYLYFYLLIGNREHERIILRELFKTRFLHFFIFFLFIYWQPWNPDADCRVPHRVPERSADWLVEPVLRTRGPASHLRWQCSRRSQGREWCVFYINELFNYSSNGCRWIYELICPLSQQKYKVLQAEKLFKTDSFIFTTLIWAVLSIMRSPYLKWFAPKKYSNC